ncbi:beta-ketoacyl synthase N-terminal-like domain-containing protein [Roseateles sp.]|uniref:beta-ketoacyl synthase N-terminal-like domain-containing protein n=1 Tax=Roseateles sp. TaxID=1971397 RepID=UPI0039EAFDF3
MNDAALIISLGATTAVGQDAWASAAAVRAGVSGFTQHPYMIDTAGEPMRAAIAPWIDITVQGIDRFEALLFPAIDEALATPLQASVDAGRWAIALGLPSSRPGLPENIGPELLKRVKRRYAKLFSAAAAFNAGHAAGLFALQAACAKLSQGDLDACIVAGVDSWIEPETLEWLESCDQLHGAGALNNAWGFIPGEAGSALLLVRAAVANSLKQPALASVLGVGLANEPNRIMTNTICIGKGLTDAFRGALASLPMGGARVSDTYCDMNGEPYRSDEFGFTALRTKEHFASVSHFTAPADCWGDVGAAGSPLHLALACAAAEKGYASGPTALVWASATTGERAAALIACSAPGTRRVMRS